MGRADRVRDRDVPAGDRRRGHGDFNSHAYGTDLRSGTHLDPVTRPLREAGFVDAHLGLAPSRRAVRTGRSSSTSSSGVGQHPREVFRSAGLCDGADCAALSDHRAVWATLQLE